VEGQHILESTGGATNDPVYGEYIEIIIQYGYLMLFSLTFPLAPLLALINNIFEIQVDKTKFLNFSKRPIPMEANSIGVWRRIITTITYLAIIVNAGVLIFTYDILPGKQFYAFILLTLAIITIKILFAFSAPETPENLKIVARRHNNIIDNKLKDRLVANKPRMEREKTNFNVVCPQDKTTSKLQEGTSLVQSLVKNIELKKDK
jgi:hypothetical protein